jgi:hypothetical protein
MIDGGLPLAGLAVGHEQTFEKQKSTVGGLASLM